MEKQFLLTSNNTTRDYREENHKKKQIILNSI